MPKYSVVVPFHNEEENVTTLYDRLKAVMEQVGERFELVFVDDGSRDRTYRLLEEIAAVDSRVLVVSSQAAPSWVRNIKLNCLDSVRSVEPQLGHLTFFSLIAASMPVEPAPSYSSLSARRRVLHSRQTASGSLNVSSCPEYFQT